MSENFETHKVERSDQSQEDYLESLKKSVKLVREKLSQQALELEKKWKTSEKEKLELLKEKHDLIEKSNVMHCITNIFHKTRHWKSWSENKSVSWQLPESLVDVFFFPSVGLGAEKTFERILFGKIYKSRKKLETTIGLKKSGIELFLYISEEGDFGVVEVVKSGELVLEFDVHSGRNNYSSYWCDNLYRDLNKYYPDRSGIKFVSSIDWFADVLEIPEHLEHQKRLEKMMNQRVEEDYLIQRNKL